MSSSAKPVFLSIVMPAYNEQPRIEAVIREHVEAIIKLADSLDDWEIVCLDDGSRDDTTGVIERLSLENRKIRLLRHAQNKGIFQSLNDLYFNARGTHIYCTGSDGQWPASNLLKIFPTLRAGADLVIGVRQNRRAVYSLRRRFISHGYDLLTRMLFGVATGDAGSIKLGVRDIFVVHVISRSPFAEAERIIRASKRRYRIQFVPIEFLPRMHGKAKGASLRNVVASVRDCFRLARQMKHEKTYQPAATRQPGNGS
jgi:glycosyltransferase involved in cell wall biosynthesis